MARVALIAMLLLTLLPSMGRLLSQPRDQLQGSDTYTLAGQGDAEPALGAMCTSRGLVYDPVVAALEASNFDLKPKDRDRPSPAPHHPDCDYCTLSASVVAPGALFVSLPPLLASELPSVGRSYTSTWVYPLGLGSRGPPLSA